MQHIHSMNYGVVSADGARFSLVNVIVGVVVDDVLMNQKKTEDTSLEQQALVPHD